MSYRHGSKGLEWLSLKQWPVASLRCHSPVPAVRAITDSKDGLLVENGDIEGLAGKICYLIENEKVRKEMGKQARINVERFKIEHVAQEWRELFETLTKQPYSDQLS